MAAKITPGSASRRASLLGEALMSAPFFAFVADENMRYLAVNEHACRELGYAESELLQLSVTDIVTEPMEPEVAYGTMRQRGALSGIAVLVTKSGWEIPIRFMAGSCADADGRVVYLSVAERTDLTVTLRADRPTQQG